MRETKDTVVPARGEPGPNGQASLSDRVRSLRLQPNGPAVRPRSAWLPWGVTAIALATAMLFGWRAYRLSPADRASIAEGTNTGDVRSTAPSGTPSPSPASSGDVVLDAKGYVIAAHQIQLSPQVGGEIIWLDPAFKEGAVYKKGDVLAKIDPVIYAARVKSADAARQVAEVNLKEVESGSALQEIRAARAQMTNMGAKLELARIDERNKRRAGVATSRDDMEKAIVQTTLDQAGYEMHKQTVDRLEVALGERRLLARAQLQKSQADVEEAEKQLKNCTILAPTTGIVLSKKAELGGYVNPLAFGAAGYLCEMADLRDLEVELDIQERDISRVKQGQRCRIMPEAGQRDEAFLKTHPAGYVGVVSRRMPVANRSKGAVTVRVKIDIPAMEQSGEFLLPDMGVLVSFLK
ncbi:MAG: efflux RND transporter periplasmic adaptor subunit [Gemmataceae bacterium]|nr:efflux RND transporter periplasmic adaptor subunit [Gemmataceae bacterium]